MKSYLDVSSLHWIQPSTSSCPLQMKAMKVVLMKTYQHLYGKLLAYTMCPVWSMHLLTPSTPHQPLDQPHPNTQSSPVRPVCRHLSFNSDQDQDTSLVCMETSSSRDITPEPLDDEESSEDEDFQTVPLDDENWTTEIIPERTFCLHENGLPNNVCSYPCPYGTNGTSLYIDSLDLSDISDLEGHFLTTSDDEELPGLEEVPY